MCLFMDMCLQPREIKKGCLLTGIAHYQLLKSRQLLFYLTISVSWQSQLNIFCFGNQGIEMTKKKMRRKALYKWAMKPHMVWVVFLQSNNQCVSREAWGVGRVEDKGKGAACPWEPSNQIGFLKRSEYTCDEEVGKATLLCSWCRYRSKLFIVNLAVSIKVKR